MAFRVDVVSIYKGGWQRDDIVHVSSAKDVQIQDIGDSYTKTTKGDDGSIVKYTYADCTVCGRNVVVTDGITGVPNTEFDNCYCATWKDFSTRSPLKCGPYTIYYPNGQIKEKGNFAVSLGYCSGYFDVEYKYYSNCFPDFLLKDFHPQGCVHRDGPFESYYSNGQLKVKCTYKNNEIIGPYILYKEDGSIDKSGSYINGEFVPENLNKGKETYQIIENDAVNNVIISLKNEGFCR